MKWVVLSLLVIVLDQVTKWLAVESLQLYHPHVITSFFNLTLAHNKGAAFSFLNSAGHWQNTFFIVLGICISLGLLIWLFRLKKEAALEAFSLSLILGGALANLIDRFHYGYVIDFIECHVGAYYWPIFNIADSAICLGAVCLLLTTFRNKD